MFQTRSQGPMLVDHDEFVSRDTLRMLTEWPSFCAGEGAPTLRLIGPDCGALP